MVKWGETVHVTARNSRFLFADDDYVSYETVVARIVRDHGGESAAADIEREMSKVERVCGEKLRLIRTEFDGAAPVASPLVLPSPAAKLPESQRWADLRLECARDRDGQLRVLTTTVLASPSPAFFSFPLARATRGPTGTSR